MHLASGACMGTGFDIFPILSMEIIDWLPSNNWFHLFFTFSGLFLFFLVLDRGRKYANNKRGAPKGRRPPGPCKLPIVGSMQHLLGEDPHHAFTRLARRYGPVMQLKLGQVNLLVISSADAAKEILKTHDTVFASRPALLAAKIVAYNCSNVAFAPYGPYWRQLRKICSLELLSARRVKMFASIRDEEASKLVKSVYSNYSSRYPSDMKKLFISYSNNVVFRAVMGKECHHQQRFMDCMHKILILVSGFVAADLFPSLMFLDKLSGIKSRLEAIHRELDQLLDEIIEERMKSKKESQTDQEKEEEEEDLLDVLLKINEKGDLEFPMEMKNIKAVIQDMFAGASETTSSSLEWIMTELVRNPEAMAKAQAEVRRTLMKNDGKTNSAADDLLELPYMEMVIKEALRLHPPIPLLLPRVCSETCMIAGYKVQAGTRVVINIWGMARNTEYWKEPESFRPERFKETSTDFRGASFEYLPFGGGRRICPGMAFGIAGMEDAMAQLLYHFDWELPGGKKKENDADLADVFGITVRRKKALCLCATPYVPRIVAGEPAP